MEQTTDQTTTLCWTDPFEGLAVGQRFRTAERVVRERDVLAFAALTGDSHPQHCDPVWAASSPFGERIAHGMLTLSLAVGLVPLDPERVLALRRLSDVVFKRAVRLDEVIFVSGEIAALRAVDQSSGLVDFSWTIRNAQERLVCRAAVQVLWRREPQPALAGGNGFWHAPVSDGAVKGEFIPVPL